ncbi:TPA: hypothetical protein N2D16_002877 [Clostridium botulinum]|nr:hypothetical protein [Clostridium botulinum]HCL4455260.1 hypothetical protein [Clostridium botulinum]
MKTLQSNIKENILFAEIGSYMELETEKAVKFMGEWIPKSQILHIEQKNKNGTYYTNFIPLWLYNDKNLGYAKAIDFKTIKETYKNEELKKTLKTRIKTDVKYYKYLNKKGTLEIPCRIYTRNDGKKYFQTFKLNDGEFEIDFLNYLKEVTNVTEYENKHNLIQIDRKEVKELLNILSKKLYRNRNK